MSPWRGLNIKSKLVALMIVIVVAPMPVIMLGMDGIVSGRIEKTGRERVESATAIITTSLEETRDKLVSYVELMMRDAALRDAAYYAMFAGERVMLFRELRKTYKVLELDNLQVLNGSGSIITAGEYYAQHDIDESAHPLVISALDNRVSGDLIYIRGRYVIQASGPLHRERIVSNDTPYGLSNILRKSRIEYEVIGAILAGVYIDKNFLRKIKMISGAQLSIMRDGKVILSTMPELLGSGIDHDLAKMISQTSRPILKKQKINNVPYIVSYLPLKNSGGDILGALQVSLDISDIENAAAASRMYLLGIMVLSLMVALFLAYFMADSITKPVRKLEEGATRIGKGDFDSPISVRTGDELESLSVSFNKMAAALKEGEKDRERYLTELEEKNKQMLLAERHASLGRVAAHVAHEVGNPLTSIYSFVQMLKKRKYDQFTEDALDTIYKHIERISNIVTQLTGLARPAPDGPAVCSIQEAVDDSLKILRFDRRLRDVRVEKRDMGSLPSVAANRDQIQQVFVNLILNAAEAMPEGGELAICGGMVNGEGLPPSLAKNSERYVFIDFSDTGCGVPAEKMDQIFEPFYSAKSSGSGLGLSLSHGIVRRFNGELTLTPRGKGSTFRVYLPAVKDKNE